MARLADDSAFMVSGLQSITKLTVPLTSPVTAALTAANAVDDEALTFLKTAFTGAAGKWILVDSGLRQSAYKLGTIPSGSEPIPITRRADFAHPIGAAVKLMSADDHGYIEEGSATFSASSSTASKGAANASGVIWNGKPTIGQLTASWKTRAASLENLASMYGIPEDLIKGNGTGANLRRVLAHPNTMATQVDFAYLITTVLVDGTFFNRLLLNPTPTVNAGSALGAQDEPMTADIGCVYTHHLDFYSKS